VEELKRRPEVLLGAKAHAFIDGEAAAAPRGGAACAPRAGSRSRWPASRGGIHIPRRDDSAAGAYERRGTNGERFENSSQRVFGARRTGAASAYRYVAERGRARESGPVTGRSALGWPDVIRVPILFACERGNPPPKSSRGTKKLFLMVLEKRRWRNVESLAKFFDMVLVQLTFAV